VAILVKVQPDDGERFKFPGVRSVIVSLPTGLHNGIRGPLTDDERAYVETVVAPLIEPDDGPRT
jgi:hypothetical protein